MNAETLSLNFGEPRALKTGMRIAASLAVLLSLAVVLAQIQPHLNRPVESIRVEGQLTHLTPGQLAAQVGIAPGTKLFELNLIAVRDQLQALPWVATAEVIRQWPVTVTVRVRERQAVARWGENALLDSDGQVFRPDAQDVLVDMPRLTARDEDAAEVWSAYRDLAAGLGDSPLALAALTLDERGEWMAETRAVAGHAGITLRLGQEDPRTHLGMLREAVLANLSGKLEQVAYIDLRYPNGFSVGWIGGHEPGRCPPVNQSGPNAAAAKAACARLAPSPTMISAVNPATAMAMSPGVAR